MNNELHDIDVLENAIIAFTEGASDEKRMALWSLERLVQEKRDMVERFEQEFGEE